MELTLPPLRERKEDIALLFTHFLQLHADSYEANAPKLSSEEFASLMSYDWPGNIRELRHVAERRLLLAHRGVGSVKEVMGKSKDETETADTLRSSLASYERSLIIRALKVNNGRMETTSETLGIGRRTLNEKLVKLDINRKDYV